MANRKTISLRTKISGLTTLMVLLVALMLGGLSIYNQLSHIRKFQERFIKDSMRSAAAISYTLTPFMVSDNFLAMNRLASFYAERSDRLYIMVVDNRNRIVADNNAGNIGQIYKSPVAYRVDNIRGGKVRRFPRAGREAVEISYPVKAGDLVLGKVVMGLNMSWLDEETAVIKKTMIFSTMIALAVIFLGTLLTSLLAKRVSQPIRLLTEAAVKVGRGDYSQRIHVKSRDEVGILAETFDTMVGEIRSARTQLVEKNLLQARLRLAQFALSHSLEELLQATLDEVEALTGSVISFYHFLEPDQKTLSLQAWSTNTVLKMCTTEGKGRHYDIDEAGVWVDCIRERRPVIHNDYSALQYRKGLPPGHADVVRELVVPVFRGDSIVAIVGVGNKLDAYDHGDVETVSYLADLAWDLVERKKAEQALVESEERYRSVVENVSIGISVISPTMEIISLNRTMKSWYPDIDVEARPVCYRSFHNPSKNEICSPCPTSLTLKDGQVHEAITESLLDGKTVNYRVLACPIRDQDGNVVAAIEMIENITERRRSEEALRASEARLRTSLREKEILLKEVHHRVKNNLQVVASMLSLQSRYLEDDKAKEMFEDSRRRVESMSLIHEKLYRSKDLEKIDFREYVRELVRNVAALNAGILDRMEIMEDVGEVILDVNKGIPCGLIINELLSNSIRHAFPEQGAVKILVKMRTDGGGNISLAVSDNGVGFPGDMDFRNTKSLGMQLVISLANQLDGTIALDKSKGTAFTITFRG